MTATLRVSLSFLLAVVMTMVVGLTLAEPAEAKVPETESNPVATFSGPPAPSSTDVLVWVGVDGPEAGSRLVIDKGLLDTATFGYRAEDGYTTDGGSFGQVVAECRYEYASCSRQVAANMRQVQSELRDATNSATSQCQSPNSRGLRIIPTRLRVSLIKATVVTAIASGGVYGGNALIGLPYSDVNKLVALIATGTFLSTIAGDFAGEAEQRVVAEASIVAMNAFFAAMKRVAAQIREAPVLAAQQCANLASYLRGADGAEPEPGRTEIQVTAVQP